MAIHFILIVGRNHETIHYQNAVSQSGYIPIVTDTTELLQKNHRSKDFPCRSLLSRVRLLLLPGGGDIAPDIMQNHGICIPPSDISLYKNIDQELDLVQFAYLDYFLKQKRTVIGICKGMQLINVRLGGTLTSDMSASQKNIHVAFPHGDNSHGCTYTSADTPADFPNKALLRKMYQTCQLPAQINSAHHQCIDKLADSLIPFQYASDGILEGYLHRELPILGFQWHPERLFYPQGTYLKYFLKVLLHH